MDLQIGQMVQHTQFGDGIITGLIDSTHIKARFADDEFEKIVSPKYLKGWVSAGLAILNTVPANLSPLFIEYLESVRNQMCMRLHYPKHLESYVFAVMSREGLELPDNHRAVDSGAHGGTTIQRAPAGLVRFPTPPESNFVPSPSKTAAGITTIHSLAVVLALMHAGFPITRQC